MARRSNKPKYPIDEQEFTTLKEMGYQVHEFMPWHFRISKYEDEDYIDVFPTTRVWLMYRKGDYTGKGNYENLIDLIETKIK